jgi:phage terminase large subunit-like protein
MPADLSALSVAEKRELLALLEEKERRRSMRRIETYYPDEGPLRRELYPKHIAFFAAGAEHRERLMLAANRVGKTEGIGGYETSVHLTGLYPKWWTGRRFNGPIQAWAAGASNETTRDIVQAKLLGGVSWDGSRKGVKGTGLIPGETIGTIAWKQGVNDLVDTVQVRHVSGGWSVLGIKSYQQGRKSFEGTEKDLVWLDEEPPIDVYSECLVRTMTTNGLVLLTFTPLEGMSQVVMSFLENGKLPDSMS